MTRFRTILLLAAISLIVTISLQYTQNISNKPAATRDKKEADVDYSVRDFTLVSMNTAGNVLYHLSATSMKHYQTDDSTRLLQPRIEFHDEKNNQWVISARTGNVGTRGKTIRFEQQVRLVHSGKNEQDQLTISTESLTIKPEQHLVSSRKLIKLTGKGLTIQSNGLKADTQKGLIKLLSRVRGTYENH